MSWSARGFRSEISAENLSLSLSSDIMPSRLQTLLELALRMSAADRDPYKDDLKYVDYAPAVPARKTFYGITPTRVTTLTTASGYFSGSFS